MRQFRFHFGLCAVGLPAVGLLVAGCALREVEQAPPTLPSAFAAPRAAAQASRPGKNWYAAFGSAELSALIDQASSGNLDLSAARARVAQADARARQAGAAILPSVDAGANGNYLAGHSVNGSAHETDWSALLSASYEVDFWGKNRATARAARAVWRMPREPIGTRSRSRRRPVSPTDTSKSCRCANVWRSPP